MKRQLWTIAGMAVLASALVLLIPGESLAQRRGGGGFRGGGVRVGVGYGGGYRGGYYGGYRGGYYGGYRPGYGYGYGYRPYYGYGYGRGYGYGYRPYYGYGYGGYGASSYAAVAPTVTYSSFYPTDPGYSAQPTNGSAIVDVRVPSSAQVWFDGTPTAQRGALREFETPPLTSGGSYDVRARWMQNGQVMDQTRTVQVQPNGRAVVDFNAPQS